MFWGTNKRNWFKTETQEKLALGTPARSVVHTLHGSLHSQDHMITGLEHLLAAGALSSGPFCSGSPGSCTCPVAAAASSMVVPLIPSRAVSTLRLWPRARLGKACPRGTPRGHLRGGGLRALLSLQALRIGNEMHHTRTADLGHA